MIPYLCIGIHVALRLFGYCDYSFEIQKYVTSTSSRCLPSRWRSAVAGTVLSLLLPAAFNPLLPSQTLTASEAFDICFNIQNRGPIVPAYSFYIDVVQC